MTNQVDEEALRTEHRAICEKLNTDVATEERSWATFREIRNTYKLEGNPLHWLCCSLFVACLQTVTPTVGNTNSVLQGNCVSLTQLLRLCNIKFIEFFSKITIWSEMASLPEDQRTAINHLQHKFSVSMSIYNKYCEIFPLVFQAPNSDEPKRGKKSKPVPCSSNRLFEFIWTMFICAKAEYPEQSADLVSSNNMLLCCLNLLFANVIADGRKDLVNSDFAGLPEGFLTGKIPEQAVCIIDLLCEEGSAPNVLNTMNTNWKDVMEKFFQTNVLRGDQNSFTDVITVNNFDVNLKALNNLYDTYILSCGEFDERIALGQKQPNSMKTPQKIPLWRQTPLSGRGRVSINAEGNNFTPISTANASVNKLCTKLTGFGGKPNASLKELLKTFATDPTEILEERLAGLREIILGWMIHQKWNLKYAVAKCDMIVALYYQLFENILRVELRRRPHNIVLELCREDMFNKTLLVCSAEIVIYAHNLQQNFPWILKVFEIRPFIFYRIIELVILHHEDLLTRDIIKHLTIIEEQCIETFCWTSSSPLWAKMKEIDYKVPPAQNVEFSADLSGITPHKPGDSTPNLNDQIKNESTPSTSSAAPATGTVIRKVPNPDSAKKRLFGLDDEQSAAADSSQSSQMQDPQPSTSADSEKCNSKKDTIGLSDLGFNSPLKLPVPNGSASKRRPGATSLNLFFRKFYKIAAVRLKHLCRNLNLNSLNVVNKIWTIFEHSIVEFSPKLMRDRHLDQMLMCAIYVFVKVQRHNIMFSDIMKCYRLQPQSSSHVYRSVLISRTTPERVQERLQHQQLSGTNGIRTEGEDNRVEPHDLAGVSVQHGNEERGDIIGFYNKVYVQAMQETVMRFNTTIEAALVLSPAPKTRNIMLSPRQIDDRIPLYVTPMDHRNGDRKESPNSITFLINFSPSKELERMNHIIKTTEEVSFKRSLADPDSFEPSGPTAKRLRKGKKLDQLISDRQQQESGEGSKN